MFQASPAAQVANPNFVQGAIKKPTEEKPEPVPFYPSDAYVKYNRAPEKTLSNMDISAIAAARKKAEETGVLSPELGEHLLPIAMVEGWGKKMGVLTGGQGFYASRRLMKSLEQMGLEEDKDYVTHYIKGDKHVSPLQASPAFAAVILGEKAALKHVGGDVEKALKAYNGSGRAIEKVDGRETPADVDVYLGKVKAARRLLDHPLNEKIRTHFQREYSK